MTQGLKIVLDTNVLISAMLSPKSAPGLAFRYAAATAVLLVSESTLAEAEQVILRSKFDRLIASASRRQFLADYRSDAIVISTVSRIKACRDERDDKFLDVAVDGYADLIVTGITTWLFSIHFAESLF
jgi:putative PIN family toxin of toxin-antitoxin system